MPKYWVKNYFTHGRFLEVGQKQKTEKKKKKDRKLVITMAKLRMAHASKHGARKPPEPKLYVTVATLILCIYIWRVSEPDKIANEICLHSGFSFDTISFAPFV